MVAQLAAREPEACRYGYELGQEVGLEAGTLHPIRCGRPPGQA
jgi:hypothetical protein